MKALACLLAVLMIGCATTKDVQLDHIAWWCTIGVPTTETCDVGAAFIDPMHCVLYATIIPLRHSEGYWMCSILGEDNERSTIIPNHR